MTELRTCPECGSEIPSGSPVGLCPKCLLKAGLESHPPAADARLQATQPSPPGATSGFIPPSPEELAPRFPQLEVLELLGKGGMGAVYKARQPGLDRFVALKILPAEVSHDAAFAERFTREARALARLSHPQIVAVYDFGRTADGLFFFVMEYVDGVNLRQAIQSHSVTPQDALAIVPQICDALQFAHNEGIVHRDIKPENILIDKRGRVKIADFGLVKLLGQETADHSLTGTQQVMGTLRYMAPEQMEGSKEVDHRADIYSLGVVFYELLTGELPVGRFAPPSKKVQIDVRLDEVVLRALEREPEQRWQQASDVKTGIESLHGSMSARSSRPSASNVSKIAQSPPIGLPQMLAVAIGLVLGLLTITAGVVLIPAAFMFSEVGTGPFWGWMGGVFGCICGGFGSLAGSWNTYRQLRGENDWMQMSSWTVLDRALGIYGLVGAALLVLPPLLYAAGSLGPVTSDIARGTFHGSWLLGGLMAFQSALFLLYRMAFVSSGRYVDHDPLRQVGRKALHWLIVLIYLFGLFCFFSYSHTYETVGSTVGQPSGMKSSFHIGQPSPWFVYEVTPTGFTWGFRLFTWSSLVAAVALGALWLERRLKAQEGGRNEDIRWHYLVWAFLFAVPNGLAALSTWLKLRTATESTGPRETPGFYVIGLLLALLAMTVTAYSLWRSRRETAKA